MLAHCVFKCRMPEIDEHTKESFQSFVYAAAVCAVAAVALHILGAILTSTTFSGISARDRVELISAQVSNVATAGVVLAAVIALFQLTPENGSRFRAVVIATLIVGGVIALFALYSIGDILSRHIPSGDGQGSIGFGLAQGATLRARLGAASPQTGSLLLSLLAMFGANQIGGFFSGGRPLSLSDEDPELPEVE
jgi:hypothetical protein